MSRILDQPLKRPGGEGRGGFTSYGGPYAQKGVAKFIILVF